MITGKWQIYFQSWQPVKNFTSWRLWIFCKAVPVSNNLTMHFFVKFRCIIAECVWHEVVTMQLFNALCPSVQKCSNSNKIEHFILTYLEPLLTQTDTHFRHTSSINDSSVVPDTLINLLRTSKAYSWQPLKIFITNKQHIHNGSFVTILQLTQHVRLSGSGSLYVAVACHVSSSLALHFHFSLGQTKRQPFCINVAIVYNSSFNSVAFQTIVFKCQHVL